MSLGIENLKKLVKAGLQFGENVTKATADKKVSLFEAIGLLPEVFSFIGVVKTWKDVKAELDDLDEPETKEIEDFVEEEFNVPNAKVKTFVQHAIMQVVSLHALVEEFKHINDPVVEDINPEA